MMDCKLLQQCIDDYLDGLLPAGEQRLADQHLESCADCRQSLQELQALRHTLRSLPVPSPSPNFNERLLTRARQQHKRRQFQLSGLVTAMAASLVIWIGVALFQTTPDKPGIEAIVMGISDTRNVNLVFTAPEHFQKVTLQLELSGNIQLSGYGSKRELEWQTTLKKGANTLVLPIKATGQGQAEVVTRIKHDGKIRVFRIPINIQRSDAKLRPVFPPVSV